MSELTTEELRVGEPRVGRPQSQLVLAVLWAAGAPDRAGEVLPLGPSGGPPGVFGRGHGEPGPDETRLGLVRQRPGVDAPCPPLALPHLSRRQLRISVLGDDRLAIENVGRLPMHLDGRVTSQGLLGPGGLCEVEGQLLLVCLSRPSPWPPTRSVPPGPLHPFGAPDGDGLVGESPALWSLRDGLAFTGPRDGHVLVTGPTGAGKELAIRALHARDLRRARPLVIRNAATLPEEHLEAELFGRAAGFPDPGAEARPGLVGQADGGCLFLDGIDALPESGQAALLRLLDGDYQRLGDPETRRADVRVLATAKAAEALRPELLQRFRHVLRVPALRERVEDVPLLVRELLARALAGDPALAARYADETGAPRFGLALVEALTLAADRLEVRAVEQLLWRCLASSRAGEVELPPELEDAVHPLADDAADPLAEVSSAAAPLAANAPLPPGLRAGLATLTPAERTVLAHLSQNKTSREIGRALFVSTRTVQNHRQRICGKLGLRGNNALLEIALRLKDHLDPGA